MSIKYLYPLIYPNLLSTSKYEEESKWITKLKLNKLWITHAVVFTEAFLEILWKIGTSGQTEVPIFFITWSFARLRTSEAPTGALRESPI